MSLIMENSVPLGPGWVFFGPPKDEDGNDVTGGAGLIDWTNAKTGAVIASGVAVAWNSAKKRYQSRIEDKTVSGWNRQVGDLWHFDVMIDAAIPAKRFRDVGDVRVRSQSSA